MISLSCFGCMKGLHRVVESAINSDNGDFHSKILTSSGSIFADVSTKITVIENNILR